MSWMTALEWAGALTGLAGAFILATNSRFSPVGWLAFLAANFLMVGFAVAGGHWGLLTQQIGFTATSLLGIHRSGLFRLKTRVTDGMGADVSLRGESEDFT